MALILNIETATEVCSVCLAENGTPIATAEAEKPQSHSSNITLLIADVLAQSGKTIQDLVAVAVSEGPGSYTGLRIGASAAKGICYAQDIPLIGVDTLASLAYGCMEEVGQPGYYIPMIDARRMEVYTSVYDFEKKSKLKNTHAKIIEPDSFEEYIKTGNNIFLCGNGAEKCMEILSSPNIQLVKLGCSATLLSKLSHNLFLFEKFRDLAYFTPSYLKSPKITISKKKL